MGILEVFFIVYLCVGVVWGEKLLRHGSLHELSENAVIAPLARAHGPDPNQAVIHRGAIGNNPACLNVNASSYDGLAVNQINRTIVISYADGIYSQPYDGVCWVKLAPIRLKNLVTATDASLSLTIFGIGLQDGKVYRSALDKSPNSSSPFTFNVLLGDRRYIDLLFISGDISSSGDFTLGAVSPDSILVQQYNSTMYKTSERSVPRASMADKPFFLSSSYLCQSINSTGVINCDQVGIPSNSDISAAAALSALNITKVNYVCASNGGVAFITDGLSLLSIYENYDRVKFSLAASYTLDSWESNSWIVHTCDHPSNSITMVVSSSPSTVLTFGLHSGALLGYTNLDALEVTLTASSFIASFQGITYVMLVPFHPLVRAFGAFGYNYYYGSYYGGDGLHFQSEYAAIFGFYVLYFFGLVLIALIFDQTKVFDAYIISLARRSYVNMEDRLLKELFIASYWKQHPELEQEKSDKRNMDWEDSEMVAAYTEYIIHRKLVAAATVDEKESEDKVVDQPPPELLEEGQNNLQPMEQEMPLDNNIATGGHFSSLVSACSAFTRWVYSCCCYVGRSPPRLVRELSRQQSQQFAMPTWFFNAIRGVLFLNTTAYNPNDRRQYLSFCCYKIPFAKGYWGDLFFYICNNHTTFSTFLATPGDTYSRHGRRLTYLCVNCFTLFVVIVLKSVIPVSPTAKKLITIFCVSPTIILIRKSLYYLWACPCLDREAPEQSYMTRLLTSPGARTATLLTGAFYLGILLVGAMYTPGKGRAESIAARQILVYSYSVNIIACIQETMMNFVTFGNGETAVLLQIAGRFDVKLYGAYYYEKVKALRLRGRLYRDVKVEDRAVMRAMQLSKRLKQQQPQRVNFDLIDLHSDDDDDDVEEVVDENIVVQIDDHADQKAGNNDDGPVTHHEHRDDSRSHDTANNVNSPTTSQEMKDQEGRDVESNAPASTELSHPSPPPRHLLGSEQPVETTDDIKADVGAVTEAHAVAVNSIAGDDPSIRETSSRKLKKKKEKEEGQEEDEVKVDNDYDYVERDLKWFRRLTCGLVVATSWTDKRLYQDVLVAAMTAQTLAAQTIR